MLDATNQLAPADETVVRALGSNVLRRQAAIKVEEIMLAMALESLFAEQAIEDAREELEATRALILATHRANALAGDAFALAALQMIAA